MPLQSFKTWLPLSESSAKIAIPNIVQEGFTQQYIDARDVFTNKFRHLVHEYYNFFDAWRKSNRQRAIFESKVRNKVYVVQVRHSKPSIHVMCQVVQPTQITAGPRKGTIPSGVKVIWTGITTDYNDYTRWLDGLRRGLS